MIVKEHKPSAQRPSDSDASSPSSPAVIVEKDKPFVQHPSNSDTSSPRSLVVIVKKHKSSVQHSFDSNASTPPPPVVTVEGHKPLAQHPLSPPTPEKERRGRHGHPIQPLKKKACIILKSVEGSQEHPAVGKEDKKP